MSDYRQSKAALASFVNNRVGTQAQTGKSGYGMETDTSGGGMTHLGPDGTVRGKFTVGHPTLGRFGDPGEVLWEM